VFPTSDNELRIHELMPDIQRYYKPKTVEAGKVSRALRSVIEKRLPKPQRQLHLVRWLGVNDGIRDRVEVGFDDLHDVCELATANFSGYFDDSTNDELSFWVQGGQLAKEPAIVLRTDGKDALSFHLELVEYLGLERAVRNDVVNPTGIDDVRTGLRCFLSFDFASTDVKVYVETLRRFLDALEVDIVTGEGYEPRTIEDKVAQRLVNLDMVLLVVSERGVTEWMRDELNRCVSNGARPFILQQRGSPAFTHGIFGNIEYIEFDKGVIEQTFIKVAEGIKYIRHDRFNCHNS
jgi:hypothetical protein